MDSTNNKYSRRSFLSKSALGAGAFAAAPFTGAGKGLEQAVNKTKKYSRPSDLEITDLKVGYIRGGSHLFVKIYTNQDIVGHGEGADAVRGTDQLVLGWGRRLQGRNPLDVHRLFYEIRRSGVFGGAQSGMYLAALAAVETALWDLAGKALGVPVYQLLGGKFRDRVRVYMDTALYQSSQPSPEEFAQSAQKAVDYNMTAVKFDLDQANDPARWDRYNWTASQGEIERMYAQMMAAREQVGPDVDICADMHGRYDLPSAKKIARKMEPVNLMWLEDPIPAENPEAYKYIQEETTTPLCTGENLYLAHDFRELFEIGAVDMIMPDLQKAGGLGEGQRIANLAQLYYIPFAPHMVSSYLGAMATAHVCASVPNFMIMEWQIYFHEDPMFKEIVSWDGDQMVDEDGYLPVSDQPGIGVEINEEGMRKYATEGYPFFE
ncbi:mandelate racemase/muconate lactonizing enzyme family protein [Halalkalibaculum sp. DA384]|uniref:mandelate racemase/muconate lactonizing enzyme family protein n=1 Tax=Halalkalibaculum sp. DA384 TaxID=3373606 RepID=UPI0037541C79